MLKPEKKIAWPAGSAAAPKAAAVKKAGLGSNSITQSQLSLEQLKKTAASRGISVEKLIAQMVQQYLKEDGPAS
jgi:hypothetical protein